jgi:hypothetical protein
MIPASTAPTVSNPVFGRLGPLGAPLAGVVVAGAAAELPVLPVVLEPAPVDPVVVDVAAASTTTVAFMNGWTWQKYEKVPGWVNVCEALAPFCRIPVLKLPSVAVAVWGAGPSLVHVIVSPTWTVIDAGANLKSEIVSAGSPAMWARRL